jgi:hypothetical protein
MGNAVDELPIVKEGTWLYSGTVPVRVRLLRSPETWGTGDNADEGVIAENQPTPCFFLAFESAGHPGNFNNLVPNLMSIEEALSYVDQRFPGIKWHEI